MLVKVSPDMHILYKCIKTRLSPIPDNCVNSVRRCAVAVVASGRAVSTTTTCTSARASVSARKGNMSAKLFNCREKRPNALCRLFCFPWAGGGTNYYASLVPKFPQTIEVIAIRLPGRENRFQEPIHKSHEDLTKEVITEFFSRGYNDKPFAFFGHSFGSCMAFETARVLKEEHGMEPIYMFVSASSAPHSPVRLISIEKRSKISEEEFQEWIVKNGGTPPELGDEYLKLFVPVIREDLRLLDKYLYTLPDTPPLTCPISAFDGDKDRYRDIEGFRDLTSSQSFHLERLPGHHFYLQEAKNEKYLIDHIISKLDGVLPGVAGCASNF